MAQNVPKLYLLAYDIADPQRLQRVHRTVRQLGLPLQYSVFLVPARPDELDDLLAELSDIIHHAKDDVRVYPLPKRLEVDRYGRQFLPAGLELIRGDELSDALSALITPLADAS